MLVLVLLVGGGCTSDDEKGVAVSPDKNANLSKKRKNQKPSDIAINSGSMDDQSTALPDPLSSVNLENVSALIQADPLSNPSFIRNQNITSPDELISISRPPKQPSLALGNRIQNRESEEPNNSILQIRIPRTTQIQQQRAYELIRLNSEIDNLLTKLTEAERNNGTLKEAYINHDIELHTIFSNIDELSIRIKLFNQGRTTEILRKAEHIQEEVREIKSELNSIYADISSLQSQYGLELKYSNETEEFEWNKRMVKVTPETFLQMIEKLDASPDNELVEWKPYLISTENSEYKIIDNDMLKLQIYKLLMSLNEKVSSFGKKNKLLMNESTLRKWRSVARRANDIVEYLN